MYAKLIQIWHVSTILLLLTSLSGGYSDETDLKTVGQVPDASRLHPVRNDEVEERRQPREVQEKPYQEDLQMKLRRGGKAAQHKQPLDRVYYDMMWLLDSFPLLRTAVPRSPFPTFGLVWPLPSFWMATELFYPVAPSGQLKFTLTMTDNYILRKAVQRYHQLITSRAGTSPYPNLWRHQEASLEGLRKMAMRWKTGSRSGTAGTDRFSATLPSTPWNETTVARFHQKLCLPNENRRDGTAEILVHVKSPGLAWPHEDMDESYTLSATERGIHLYANETWGGLRGLESLSQLIWCTTDRSRLYINQTFINDYPRFRHRGLMLDTSRHYISKNNIFLNLEAMSYNKMNVLHWHIIDDQSFPYQSEEFPELSAKGAYGPHAVYNASDIKEVIEFARLRGIRVIPEFDVPGHTRSLSLSKPDIMAKCSVEGQNRVYFGTLNPISKETFGFLHRLYKEVMTLFRDDYVHVGGDEVETDCWLSDDNLQRLRSELSLDSSKMILEYFWRNMQNLITSIGAINPELRKKVIMWEDVLEQTEDVKADSLIHVWKSKPVLFLQNRRKIVYSACWYLDHLQTATDWISFYLCDPTTGEPSLVDSSYEKQILGGEVCMWTEYQSDDTILQKIWPVAATVAERLWSPSNVNDMLTVGPRLQEQSCRLSSRGIPVQTLMGPGYCDGSRRPGKVQPTTPYPLDNAACQRENRPAAVYELPIFYTFGVATGILFTYLLSYLSAHYYQTGSWTIKLYFSRISFLRFLSFSVTLLTFYLIVMNVHVPQ